MAHLTSLQLGGQVLAADGEPAEWSLAEPVHSSGAGLSAYPRSVDAPRARRQNERT